MDFLRTVRATTVQQGDSYPHRIWTCQVCAAHVDVNGPQELRHADATIVKIIIRFGTRNRLVQIRRFVRTPTRPIPATRQAQLENECLYVFLFYSTLIEPARPPGRKDCNQLIHK